jgi:hypothetical protein
MKAFRKASAGKQISYDSSGSYYRTMNREGVSTSQSMAMQENGLTQQKQRNNGVLAHKMHKMLKL